MLFTVYINALTIMQTVINEKGQRVIPGTRRPDGTWRKDTVVKEGYIVSGR